MKIRSLILVSALVLAAWPMAASAQDQISLSPSSTLETRSGVSGGSGPGDQIDASTYGTTTTGPCRGWVGATPHHVMTLSAPMPSLEIAVDAPGADTALLITGPGGTFCNDDTNRLNPVVSKSWMAGTYNIWVASYDRSGRHNYTITFRNLAPVAEPTPPPTPPTPPPTPPTPPPTPPTPPTPTPTPTPPTTMPTTPTPPTTMPTTPTGGLSLSTAALDSATLTPTDPAGQITLGPGFTPDPQIRAGNVSGSVAISGYTDNKGNPCAGFVPAAPSHVLNVASEFPYLRVTVQSGSDTVMVLRSPAGEFICNDDTFGFDPSVEGSFAPGSWRIWVGTYNPGETASYAIQFSEIPVE